MRLYCDTKTHKQAKLDKADAEEKRFENAKVCRGIAAAKKWLLGHRRRGNGFAKERALGPPNQGCETVNRINSWGCAVTGRTSRVVIVRFAPFKKLLTSTRPVFVHIAGARVGDSTME